MVTARKTFFALSLTLVVLAAVLFLAGGYGARNEVIQLGDRHFFVLASTFLLAASILPILIAFSVAGGGLGCIQRWVALPETLKRSLAYAFAAGIVLMGLAWYVRGRAAGDDYYRVFDDARWIGFWGLLFLAVPLLFHLYGFSRHFFIRSHAGRLLYPPSDDAEKNMKTAKAYALGGLVVILWVLLRAFWSGWPWETERVLGMTGVTAALFTWPLGAALGAAALFLSVLQPLVGFHERIKLTGGIIYFVGAGLFLRSLHADLLRERAWDVPISWDTATGLALLLAVFLLNLLGVLRWKETPAGDAALGSD